MYHGTWADINECEQVPKPCAHQCSNTPGSFKCVCPPGQHLLGDGKSCAGLERLPHYGTQYSSYNLARFSPVRHNRQPQQHYRQYSHLYSSYSEYRNSRTSFSRTRRTIRKTCPEGSEASHDTCIGKCQPCYISFLWNSTCHCLIEGSYIHLKSGVTFILVLTTITDFIQINDVFTYVHSFIVIYQQFFFFLVPVSVTKFNSSGIQNDWF